MDNPKTERERILEWCDRMTILAETYADKKMALKHRTRIEERYNRKEESKNVDGVH